MKTGALSVLLLLVPAYAGDTSADAGQVIEEWPQAKWGMTEPQVLRAFEGSAKKLPSPQSSSDFDGSVGTVSIDDVAVGGVSLQALFLFDQAGKLEGINLTPPDAAPPTVEQFKKIEGAFSRKYREPFRGAGNDRFLSIWMLSRSVIELDYTQPAWLKVRFENKGRQTPESIARGLSVVSGEHVFPDPMQLPPWLPPFPHEKDNRTVDAADSLNISYQANSSFDVVLIHYEDVLHAAARIGARYLEDADGTGGVIFRAAQEGTSCTVRISRGSHVDVDCFRTPSRAPIESRTVAPTTDQQAQPGRAAALKLLFEQPYEVEYSINGSASEVGITMRNSAGGTEQHDVSVPYRTTFNASAGAFVYLSAQKKDKDGTVHVSIRVDGQLLQDATASSPYGIATASGRIAR
jgi:hypothetical protein